MSPPVSLVHPTSNPNARQAALALAESGLLYEVITTFAYNPSSNLGKLSKKLPTKLSQSITQELERRSWIPPHDSRMQSYPWRETLRIAMVKSGFSEKFGFGSNGPIDWVYTKLDEQVAKHHLEKVKAIYAYEDGAAFTFEQAKKRGITCFYDLPIAFYKTGYRIQQEEAELYPELRKNLGCVNEPAWKQEKKSRELELADHIFVPSTFVKKSLECELDIDIKVSVIPFGSPITYFQPKPKQDKSFRALFVGRVGPRKGVHYLLKAWKELNLSNAELCLVGINEFPSGWIDSFADIFSYIPSVPHHTLNRFYSSANVFVFPSLLEGLALVQLEAMACGVPLITTANAGGDNIITDGVEGFIIPIRDVEALKEKLEWCYQHPQELAEMGQAARKKAEEMTWDKYRQNLANKVKDLLNAR